jgi:uncharacterized protein (DUF111 family)
MKKDRPAIMLSVLCRPELEDAVVAVLLRDTTTLGVRAREVRRHEAPRERFDFTSSLGPATVKLKLLPNQPPLIAPEYEVCRALALASGLPLAEVYRIVAGDARAALAARADVPPAASG